MFGKYEEKKKREAAKRAEYNKNNVLKINKLNCEN